MSLGSTNEVMGCMVCDEPDMQGWETWRPHYRNRTQEKKVRSYRANAGESVRPEVQYWSASDDDPEWKKTGGMLCPSCLATLRVKDLLDQLRDGVDIDE